MTLDIKFLILFSMVFLHIVDDYYLQGLLINLKQKKWWEKELKIISLNLPENKYKYDYIAALIIHSFSWSFMVHLIPILVLYFFNYSVGFLLFSIVINLIIHGIIDDLKANKMKINLIKDQIIHLIQIIIIWFIFIMTL